MKSDRLGEWLDSEVAKVDRMDQEDEISYRSALKKTTAGQWLAFSDAWHDLGTAIGKSFQGPLGYFIALSGIALALWSSYDGAATTAVLLYVASFGLLWLVLRHRRST